MKAIHRLLTAVAVCMALLYCNRDHTNEDELLLSAVDVNFIEQAAFADKNSITLAEIALKNTGNKMLKNYARIMLRRHQNNYMLLDSLAGTADLDLPTVDGRQAAVRDNLSFVEGAAFDAAYIRLQLSYQENAVKVYEYEYQHGSLQSLRQFADSRARSMRKELLTTRMLQEQLQ